MHVPDPGNLEVCGARRWAARTALAACVRRVASTVYRSAWWEWEQEAPRVLMDSIPAFPDRASACWAGKDDAVLPMLVEHAMQTLLADPDRNAPRPMTDLPIPCHGGLEEAEFVRGTDACVQ